MSMHPEFDLEIPELTVKTAKASFPKGNKYLKMRDELGTVYTDEQFVDLYPKVGQSAISPWRLALVTIVQFAEHLTDREAAEAVRSRIDLKYLLSLELNDPGFDHSVLSEFRRRLLEGGAEERLLMKMLAVFTEKKWLKAGGIQRSDSTHIIGAVRTLNQIELVGETLHHALNIIAQIDPIWLQKRVNAEWHERYGQRFTDFRLPKSKVKREALRDAIGEDGYFLLQAIYLQEDGCHLRMVGAIDVLRQVWIQQYYLQDGKVYWREAKNQPPPSRLIVSPYDVQVRCGQKRETKWRGYKVHLTESCDPDKPNLITHVETTSATAHDVTALPNIHAHLAQKGLLPGSHLVDNSYVSADTLVESKIEHHVELVGPPSYDSCWQAREADGLDQTLFVIDWHNQSAICPAGKMNRYWKVWQASPERTMIRLVFDKQDCLACQLRSRCTRSCDSPRQLTLPLQPQFEALRLAREQAKTAVFKKKYARRAGVEGVISQATHALAMRHTRYRGHAKTHLQHLATAVAINLQRALAWLDNKPKSATPVSHFARLTLAT